MNRFTTWLLLATLDAAGPGPNTETVDADSEKILQILPRELQDRWSRVPTTSTFARNSEIEAVRILREFSQVSLAMSDMTESKRLAFETAYNQLSDLLNRKSSE
jgi:hypothetical protein